MTEDEIEQEAREQIIESRARNICGGNCDCTCIYASNHKINRCTEIYDQATKDVNWFLSQPNLAIINPKAELPENPFTMRDSFEMGKLNAYNKGQQSLISQDWVKKL